MGTWKLEVFKMAVYVAFPVAMFHIFNRPEIFEESVIKTKREMFPPLDPEHVDAIRKVKELMRKKREAEIEEEFMKL